VTIQFPGYIDKLG